MTIKSSLMFAKSLVFPKAEKKSSARRSFFGALICIALSIVPLVVVVSVTSGMIDGMTDRIIGLSSSHIGCYIMDSYEDLQSAQTFKGLAGKVKEEKGVVNAWPEIQSSSLAVQ